MRVPGLTIPRIPFERALYFANTENITEQLYPLFLHDIGTLLYRPSNQTRGSVGDNALAAIDRRDPRFQSSIPPSMSSTSLTLPTPPVSTSSVFSVGDSSAYERGASSNSNMQSNKPLTINMETSSVRLGPNTPSATPLAQVMGELQQDQTTDPSAEIAKMEDAKSECETNTAAAPMECDGDWQMVEKDAESLADYAVHSDYSESLTSEETLARSDSDDPPMSLRDRKKGQLVNRLMNEFIHLFNQTSLTDALSGQVEVRNSAAANADQSTETSGQNSSQRKRKSSGGNDGLTARKDNEDDQGQAPGGDENDDNKRPETDSPLEAERRKFACPFFKRNPRKYHTRTCVGPGWDEVRRVKYIFCFFPCEMNRTYGSTESISTGSTSSLYFVKAAFKHFQIKNPESCIRGQDLPVNLGTKSLSMALTMSRRRG